MRHTITPLLTAFLTAGALTGCGAINNPYQTSSSSTATTTATPPPGGDPSEQLPATIPPGAAAAQNKLAGTAAQRTPQAALSRYADLYTNWSARDVSSVQRQLAAISLGPARAQALQAAASVTRDTLLTKSHVTNAGHVVSIAAGEGPATGQWVIVTSEHTNGQGSYQGLPPTLHVTYAHLTHTTTGWVIDQWQPQN